MPRHSSFTNKSVVFEALESRWLLTTFYNVSTYLTGNPLGDADYDPNVSVSFAGTGSHGIYLPAGESSTVVATVSGLPAHTMVKIDPIATSTPNVPDGETSTITVSAAGRMRTLAVTSQTLTTTGDAFGQWWANSSGTLTVTFDADLSPNSTGVFQCAFEIEEYEPTITASGGGGDMTEAGAGSGSATFTVSRDLPTGWNPFSNGDDLVPDTTVTVSRGGTATFGVDYQHAPNSADLPDGSVTITGSQSSKSFTVVPIDDSVAEPTQPPATGPMQAETVTWTVAISNSSEPAGLSSGIVDDSQWSDEPWSVAEPLPSSTTTFKKSDTVYANDGDSRIIYSYFITDTWDAIPGAEKDTEWDHGGLLDVTASYQTQSSHSWQGGASGEIFSFNYQYTASSSASYSFHDSKNIPDERNSRLVIVGFVKHRRLFTTQTYQSLVNGQWTQDEFDENTDYEGVIGGTMVFEVKKQVRQWKDEEA